MYTLAEDKRASWKKKHETLYWELLWVADTMYLLYHWRFNWNYVKCTLRLPVLKKSAEFHNKKLDRIIKQREDQHALFSPQELEDFAREMGELKETQGRKETYAKVIEVLFLLFVGTSTYNDEYVSYNKSKIFFEPPVFILLNIQLLYCVVKMRSAIKSMPNLFPNENLVFVHVLLFTAVSALWIVERLYITRSDKAYDAYKEDPTEENDHA